MKTWVKVLASLLLCFHIFAVFVFPNPDSLLSRQTSWFLFPYGNFLGLNTTWRFFSPNPLIHVLEYKAYSYDELGDITFEKKSRFPESLEAVGSRENFNRLMNFAMLASAREAGLKKILGPYLCRKMPEAQEINFYHLSYELPSLEAARIKSGNFESLAEPRRRALPTVDCEEVLN